MTHRHTAGRARLGTRNQLTLPAAIVRSLGMVGGDRFAIELDSSNPDVIHLRRIRASYAGTLKGVYPDGEAYVDAERTSWRGNT